MVVRARGTLHGDRIDLDHALTQLPDGTRVTIVVSDIESQDAATEKRDPDEIARRGQARYDREIRATVESEHHGKFLVLEVDSGDYEVDADRIAAAARIRERRPDAPLYVIRIGYAAAVRLGPRGRVPGA